MKKNRGLVRFVQTAMFIIALGGTSLASAQQSVALHRELAARHSQELLWSLLLHHFDSGSDGYDTTHSDLIRCIHHLDPEARRFFKLLRMLEENVKVHRGHMAKVRRETRRVEAFLEKHGNRKDYFLFQDIQNQFLEYRLLRHLRISYRAGIPGGSILQKIDNSLDTLQKNTKKYHRFRVTRYRNALQDFHKSLHAAESTLKTLLQESERLVADRIHPTLKPVPAILSALSARIKELDWRANRKTWWFPRNPSPLAEFRNDLSAVQPEAKAYEKAVMNLERHWAHQGRLLFTLLEAHTRTLESTLPDTTHQGARNLARVKKLQHLLKQYMIQRQGGLTGISTRSKKPILEEDWAMNWLEILDSIQAGRRSDTHRARQNLRSAFKTFLDSMNKEDALVKRLDVEASALIHHLEISLFQD